MSGMCRFAILDNNHGAFPPRSNDRAVFRPATNQRAVCYHEDGARRKKASDWPERADSNRIEREKRVLPCISPYRRGSA